TGKLSRRSLTRLAASPFFAKRLYSEIDRFCVQSPEMEQRFLQIGVPQEKIQVTGNLKLGGTPSQCSLAQRPLQDLLALSPNDCLITLGSTHEGEEELLLAACAPLMKRLPNLKVLLVPRHPERFDRVYKRLQESGYNPTRMSEGKKEAQVV